MTNQERHRKRFILWRSACETPQKAKHFQRLITFFEKRLSHFKNRNLIVLLQCMQVIDSTSFHLRFCTGLM